MSQVLILYICLIFLFFALAKSKQWHILSMLGFKDDTPAVLTNRPRLFFSLRCAFFTIALMVSCGLAVIQWYTLSVISLSVWTAALWTGRKTAFMQYRRIIRKMIADADNHQKRQLYEAVSDITDQELTDIMNIFTNTATQKSKSKNALSVPSR